LEINWSTFILEIVNFLVLVWILKRFLYRPVLNVIDRRRSEIAETLDNAQSQLTEAQTLQERYEGRLAAWEEERQQAHKELAREIEEQRSKQVSELRATLEREREKSQVADARRLADLRAQAEQSALELGARFATRLLAQSATQDLQARLLDLSLTQLASLPAGHLAASGAPAGASEPIVVTSAFALTDAERTRVREALTHVADGESRVEFSQDPELLAGLSVSIGSYLLGLNLRDELAGFARLGDGT
jgi:F-type H+-transporting ATPase subunit b